MSSNERALLLADLDPGPVSPGTRGLARELGLTVTMAGALERRGQDTGAGLGRWLDPKLAHLTPPDAMADRAVAAERIARAIRARERIAIFGDYDCDGMTATAILTEVVRALGGEVAPLTASRFAGGYGLSAPALERVRATGAGLLVTCDCGSTDHERLAAARAAGIDAVVIDHHLVPDEPLPVVAFLNPHRPGCGFPYKGLASCGLALSIAAELRKLFGKEKELDLRRWLDLVAIGTIADVAPLDGDNRILVRAGLGRLCGPGTRPGLAALAARLPGRLRPISDDVAFRVAPRLNAPGRLGDPALALELLLCRDPARAAVVAAEVDEQNRMRREIGQRMEAEAVADVEAAGWARDPALLVAREGWNPGIVGIVAGRLVNRYGKPTLVVALEGGRGVGSARGPAGSRLYDGLRSASDLLVRFGGHQAAAGVEFLTPRLETLRDRWRDAFVGAALAGTAAAPADVRLDPDDEVGRVLADLERLEPCGQKNPAPRLFVSAAEARACRPIKGHLRLELAWQGRRLVAFGPDQGSMAAELEGQRVDLVGRLQRSTYIPRFSAAPPSAGNGNGSSEVELLVERAARAAS